MSSLLSRGFRPASEVKAASEPAKPAEPTRMPERITPVIQSDIRADPDAATFATLAHAERGRIKRRRVMTTFRMDESARERLTTYAAAKGLSLSDLLRDLTERLAARLPKPPAR